MEEVLASWDFYYLCTWLKVDHADNTFCDFVLILVLDLLVVNHLIHWGVELHLFLFHLAGVGLWRFSVLKARLDEGAANSASDADTHDHTQQQHQNGSLVQNSRVTNIIRAQTMRDPNFKLWFCLRFDVPGVNMHRYPICVLEKYFGKALLPHYSRLLEQF